VEGRGGGGRGGIISIEGYVADIDISTTRTLQGILGYVNVFG
jgi:hypothetical protein